MTRTFSKVFGLGGVRVGWCYAPPAVIDVLNRVRSPFNVPSRAQAAAIAALAEPGWVEKGRAHNAEYRPKLAAGLQAAGIRVWPREGNFVLADFGTPERAKAADALLRSRGRDRPSGRRLRAAALPAHHDRHRGGGGARVEALALMPWRSQCMPEPLFRRLALIGVGLIGSSLARIARERGDLACRGGGDRAQRENAGAGEGARLRRPGRSSTRRGRRGRRLRDAVRARWALAPTSPQRSRRI